MDDFKRVLNDLEKKKRQLIRLRDDVLPIKVGNIAIRHFKKNFRDGGWNDNGLKKWKTTRRQESGRSDAASRNGPLCSQTDRLMNSIVSEPGKGRVTVLTNVKYAPVHNTGMNIQHKVTPKMRRFAWAKFFEAAGIQRNDTAKEKKQKEAAMNDGDRFWKRLALTPRTSIIQHIPQRQFMGYGKELDGKIEQMIKKELSEIINS